MPSFWNFPFQAKTLVFCHFDAFWLSDDRTSKVLLKATFLKTQDLALSIIRIFDFPLLIFKLENKAKLRKLKINMQSPQSFTAICGES